MRLRHLLMISLVIVLIFGGCQKEDENNNNTDTEITYFPVLLESFTNVFCGPCVYVHDALELVMEHYESQNEKPVLIEFHHYLYPNDPFQTAATSLHNTRCNYYELTYIPVLIVDGDSLTNSQASNANEIRAVIDSLRLASKPAAITIDAAITGDSVTATLNVEADTTIIGLLYCFLARKTATIMNEIPGSNGLTEYHYVAAAGFTDVGGTSIAIPAGDNQEFQYAIPIPDEIDSIQTDGYTVVAFIQNSEKTVLGAKAKDID